MTTINNNFNLNLTVNSFNVAPGNQLAGAMTLQLASGLLASYFQPMMASAFASARLPSLFNIQGGSFQTAPGSATPSFVPQNSWTASMKGESQASIDLGDGYTLEIDERNSQMTINNANTGESTRIWGDPHVDVAAEIGVPALYRRQALAGARRARHKRFEAARIAGTGKAFVGGTARLGWGLFGHGHEIVTVGALVSRGR